MSRISSIKYLLPADQAAVEQAIRLHHYAQFDTVRNRLKEQGISVSRSALHRYALQLKTTDSERPADGAATIVLIIDRSSGRVATLKSETSLDALAALIVCADPA